MQQDDKQYFESRARQESERGSQCEDNAAARAHLGMAEEYDRRAAAIASVRG